MPNLDIITIGGATRDILFYTKEAKVIKNPQKEPTCEKLLCFEYGAKIKADHIHFTMGGGGLNTAVAFSRLGLKVASIVRLGSDKEAEEIIKYLKKEKVKTKLIEQDKISSTGLSFIVISGRGDHTAFLYRGANDELRIMNYELRNFKIKWVYLSSLTGDKWREMLDKVYSCHGILRRFAPQDDTKVSLKLAWNPGVNQLKAGKKSLEKYLKKTEVLILNKDEATELVLSEGRFSQERRHTASLGDPQSLGGENIRTLLKTLHSWGVKIVAITCGVKGAHLYDGKKIYSSSIYPAKVVDTTGAGDGFGASLVAGLILTKGDIEKSLKMAIINSASVVSQIGAQEGLLKYQEIENRLKSWYY